MKYNQQKHNRKSIRLKEYDYSFPGWYYVTICAHGKNNLFGKIKNGNVTLNNIGKIVEEEWTKTKEIRKNVDLDYYIIMPNHLHGIIILNGRGELNSPKGNGERSSQIKENVGATRWVARDKEEKAIQRIAPTKETLIPNSLGSIIGQFKSTVTKRLRKLSGDPKLIVWQRNYYEHIIRNELDLYNIRQYILNNPLKWELDEYYNC